MPLGEQTEGREKKAAQNQLGEESEKRERSSPAATRVRAGGGQKVQDRSKVPCSPGEACSRAGCPPAAHGETLQEQQCVERSPWWDRRAGVTAPLGDPHPMVLSHFGAVLEELQPMGGQRRISLGSMASCGRDPMLEQGQRATTEEQQRQSVMDHPQPLLPCAAQRSRVEEGWRQVGRQF